MSESVYAGLTSQTIDVFLPSSASTTGAGLTGLVYDTVGLSASYRKGATGSRVAISLATQTVGGAWSSGGFVEIDATNMPGVYRFDLVDLMVDTEGFCTAFFHGAANLAPTPLRIDCRPLPADIKKINADATAAANLALSAAAICTGTVDAAASTTSIPTSAFSPAMSAVTANQLVGRIVIFRRDTTTVALRGQATDITASSASATPTLTVTALTAAPVSGDVFIVV